ncbi:MAG: cobalt ECF transporter T component CbiQ [Actinobacteria bacterium]|nr:cobalt ECF transporter T component CbiQ [Actinomycetota bacterium]
MNITISDNYEDKNSAIHRLDPRTKIICLILFIFVVTLTPPLRFLEFCAYTVLLIGLILISKLSLLKTAKRALAIIPLVLLIAIFLPFLKAGNVIYSFNIYSLKASVTDAGLIALWNSFIKSLLSITSMIILTSTTSFPEIMHGMQKLRIPKIIVMLISFMYRYIFVLVNEVQALQSSWHSRYFGKRFLRQISTMGTILGFLFIRTYEKSERIFLAMSSRGYEGEIKTIEQLRPGVPDAVFSGCFLIFISLIKVMSLI